MYKSKEDLQFRAQSPRWYGPRPPWEIVCWGQTHGCSPWGESRHPSPGGREGGGAARTPRTRNHTTGERQEGSWWGGRADPKPQNGRTTKHRATVPPPSRPPAPSSRVPGKSGGGVAEPWPGPSRPAQPPAPRRAREPQPRYRPWVPPAAT